MIKYSGMHMPLGLVLLLLSMVGAVAIAGVPHAFQQGQQAPSTSRPTQEKSSEPFSGDLRIQQMEIQKLGFGADDRQPMLSERYPWSAIGRVEQKNGAFCTGSLIAEDIVITNAHCVLNEGKLVETVFKPNFKEGKSSETIPAAWTCFGTNDPDSNRNADWAILRLGEPIGKKYGWLGLANQSDAELLNQTVIFAGYSSFPDEKRPVFVNGNTAAVHIGCRITQTRDGIIKTNCDTARGSSGGPVFVGVEKPYVVAINAAEYRGNAPGSFWERDERKAVEFGNVAVPVRNFFGNVMARCQTK